MPLFLVDFLGFTCKTSLRNRFQSVCSIDFILNFDIIALVVVNKF